MSKRNIAYIKPQEPSFLKRIKEQVGYKEGPTVDTKRDLANINPEDLEDSFEEQPTVVVLKTGDLTAEEAEVHKLQLEKEESEKPADLAAPIVFKAPKRKSVAEEEIGPVEKKKSTKSKKLAKKSLLSFDEDEENDA